MARKRRVPKLTASNTKNLIGVGKVLIPVLAPIALKAAAVARDRYDQMRARKLGVPVDSLAQFSGRGGALHARLVGVGNAIGDLRTSGRSTPEADEFAAESEQRLIQLAAAVRAAERMPSTRRKAAHHGVAAELDRMEAELLRRFGVS